MRLAVVYLNTSAGSNKLSTISGLTVIWQQVTIFLRYILMTAVMWQSPVMTHGYWKWHITTLRNVPWRWWRRCCTNSNI